MLRSVSSFESTSMQIRGGLVKTGSISCGGQVLAY